MEHAIGALRRQYASADERVAVAAQAHAGQAPPPKLTALNLKLDLLKPSSLAQADLALTAPQEDLDA